MYAYSRERVRFGCKGKIGVDIKNGEYYSND
jgi:hypothetical protein